jgi:hypothetical protein
MRPKVAIHVRHGDALKGVADVLALKYAQCLYGVDAQVAEELTRAGWKPSLPKPWGFQFVESVGRIAPARVLFVGVPPLNEFGYREIRVFARTVLTVVDHEAPETKHLSLTVHGPGYGLDEVEAFEAQLAGIIDAARSGDIPQSLRRITIVESNKARAQRLTDLLADLLPDGLIDSEGRQTFAGAGDASERMRAAGYASEAKAHVFVAMPFKEEMDDTYHYGIHGAVRAAGFLCERADLSSFTGDVLEWVRSRIRTASLVVADLTDANPNVYLEVGYAWGCGIRTVLLVRDAAHLRFDIRGQRCLVYRNIKHLEESLARELKELNAHGDV